MCGTSGNGCCFLTGESRTARNYYIFSNCIELFTRYLYFQGAYLSQLNLWKCYDYDKLLDDCDSQTDWQAKMNVLFKNT